MIRKGKILGTILLTSLIGVISVIPVFAAGSVSVTGDKESAAVGDSFVVTIDALGSPEEFPEELKEKIEFIMKIYNGLKED